MTVTSTLHVLLGFAPKRGTERIRTSIPNLELHIAEDEESFTALLPEAEVMIPTVPVDKEVLASAKKLKWIQFFSGGVELSAALVESPIQVTCLKGCFNITAAEFAIAGMLAFNKKLEYDIRMRVHRSYTEMEPEDIHGKTVLIIGLGSMGEEIARHCQCFNMRIYGITRTKKAQASSVAEIVEPTRMHEILSIADFVIVCVPATPLTEGIIGRRELEFMKKSAYLIDVSGRTSVYDMDALIDALRTRGIAGAHLQIEPDKDSPLWDLDNLLISFHRVVSRQTYDLAIERFCENLCRYRAGEPLLGLVDKRAGY